MAQAKVKKIGKYDVVDVLGRGGMGVVYKAVDPAIGRTVAIKMITGAFADDPDLLKRFYREAQSTGNLQHPNIVTVYDLGDEEGVPYLVIEFLEGEGLDKIIAGRRPMSLVDKLNLAIQVCNGLHYAHQRTVIHRDIKPPNVMVLKDGNVKIVDFGIARIGNDNLTRPGQVVGSIHYMSPEQVNAQPMDCRTDIFSAGVLLYELLTFALPFEGKDMGSTLLKILQEPPPPLGVYLKSYPPELDIVLQRALAKDREERYQTAEDFAFDLIRVQEQLKREMVSDFIVNAENLVQQQQWVKAKEEISHVLKIDRQNSRAIEMSRVIQAALQKQQRSDQVRQLKAQAETAMSERRLDEALAYVEEAIGVDKTNPELLNLRELVQAARAQKARFAEALRQAESAHDAGELDAAKAAAEEALALEPNDPEAKALHSAIVRDHATHERDRKVQGLVDEARKQISSRRYTSALEALKKAEEISPTAAAIQELSSLAHSGREQERRRKDVEAVIGEIQEALDRDDYVVACGKADEALVRFPDDRTLLKLKKLADNQREAGETRKQVDAQIAGARKLLDVGDAAGAQAVLRAALQRFPSDKGLQALLAIVSEAAAREDVERRKSDYVQRAKDAIRRKAFPDAIHLLETARAEIGGTDFDDLLQFARDEVAAQERRLKVDAAAERAQALIASEDYEGAVKFLETTLQELPDEELGITLQDAKRHIDEYKRRVSESVATAERLLKGERYTECVRYLEAQPATIARNGAFQQLLTRAREELAQIQAISGAKEAIRDALSRDDFLAAQSVLEAYVRTYGQSTQVEVLRREIGFRQSEATKATVDKALSDVRMLLLVRSYRAALNILNSVSASVPSCPPETRQQYETYTKDCAAGLEKQKRESEQRRADTEDADTVVSGSSSAAGGETIVAGSKSTADETIFAGSAASAPAAAPPAAKPAPPAKVEAAKPAPPAPPAKVEAAKPAPAPPVAPPPAAQPEKAKAPVSAAAPPPAAAAPPKAPAAPPAPKTAAPAPAAPPPPAAAAPAPPTPAALPKTPVVPERLSKKERKAAEREARAVAKPAEPAPAPPAPLAAAAKPAPPAPAIAQPRHVEPAPARKVHEPEVVPAVAAKSKTWMIGAAAAVLVVIGVVVMVTRKSSPPAAVSVVIRTAPEGATVHINDRVCVTPLCTLQLAPGEYDAQATLDGYEPASKHFTVTSSPASIDLPLTAKAAAAAHAPAPAQPAETPPAAPAEPKVAAKATLAISAALPGSRVSLDGRQAGTVGRDGRFRFDVDPGNHVIELSRDGYQPRRIERRFASGEAVNLSGSQVAMTAVAKPAPGTAPPPAAPPAPAPAPNEAATEWARISGSGDAATFEQYLRKYPSSPFSAEASRKVDAIRAEAARKAAPVAAAPQPSAPAPQPRAAAPDATDRQAILVVIGRYASAYEGKNADQVARLWPSLPKAQVKKIQDSFKNASSVRMNIQPLGEPTVDGDHATAVCSRSMQWTFREGAQPPVQDRITLKFSRQNGSWVIDAVQ